MVHHHHHHHHHHHIRLLDRMTDRIWTVQADKRYCPSAIGPSLFLQILLPVLGTVCPNMSRPHPLCLFSEVASRLSSSGVLSHDSLTTTIEVPAQWQLSDTQTSLFTYLLTYLQSYTSRWNKMKLTWLEKPRFFGGKVSKFLCFKVFISFFLDFSVQIRPDTKFWPCPCSMHHSSILSHHLL